MPIFGISTLDTSGSKDTLIDIGEGSEVYGEISAITAVTLGDSTAVRITNEGGLIQGNGLLAPTIFVGARNGATINNFDTDASPA